MAVTPAIQVSRSVQRSDVLLGDPTVALGLVGVLSQQGNQFCYSSDEAGPGLAVGDAGAGAIEVDRHVRCLSFAVVGSDSRGDVTRSALWATVFPSDAAQ